MFAIVLPLFVASQSVEPSTPADACGLDDVASPPDVVYSRAVAAADGGQFRVGAWSPSQHGQDFGCAAFDAGPVTRMNL